MSTPQEQQIGAGWIAVLIILLVMLVVGLVLYLRMGVSLDIPRKAPTSASAHRVCIHSAMLPGLYLVAFDSQATGIAFSPHDSKCSV